MLQTNAIDTVTWLRIKDSRSVEEATLEASDVGYRFAGTILSAESGLPLRNNYEISWDRDCRTQQCTVEQIFGGVLSGCTLRNTGQRWFVNGVEDSALDGCVDIDLGISPSTNTSAINRLKLSIGETQIITVAYISFPKLSVAPVKQSYERTTIYRYAYRNIDTNFTAAIDVDCDGLVSLYHGVWERLAKTRRERQNVRKVYRRNLFKAS